MANYVTDHHVFTLSNVLPSIDLDPHMSSVFDRAQEFSAGIAIGLAASEPLESNRSLRLRGALIAGDVFAFARGRASDNGDNCSGGGGDTASRGSGWSPGSVKVAVRTECTVLMAEPAATWLSCDAASGVASAAGETGVFMVLGVVSRTRTRPSWATDNPTWTTWTCSDELNAMCPNIFLSPTTKN
eukprot:gene5899-biopygen9643